MFLRRSNFLIIVCFLLLYPFENIDAFDGKREGFFMGFGIGPGITSGNASSRYSYFKDAFSLTWNYKIGYATSEKAHIYFMTRSSPNFPMDRAYSSHFPSIELYTDAVSGLGLMVFPSRDNNFYVSVYFGVAVVTHISLNLYDISDLLPLVLGVEYIEGLYTGPSMSCGIGYEISPNLTVDFTAEVSGFYDYSDYFYADEYIPGETWDDSTYRGNIVTFSLALNVIFY